MVSIGTTVELGCAMYLNWILKHLQSQTNPLHNNVCQQ